MRITSVELILRIGWEQGEVLEELDTVKTSFGDWQKEAPYPYRLQGGTLCTDISKCKSERTDKGKIRK